MTKFAYFPGCKIAHHLPEYGRTTEAVCAALGVELVHMEFSCCGWPMRNESLAASVYSAMRNLVMAARAGLRIMTPCKCCFGNLKHAQARFASDENLAREIRKLLAAEGLASAKEPVPPAEAVHLLTMLDRDVGVDVVREKSVAPLDGLKVACHYGCHALRPGHVTGFDDPLAPTIFERIVQAMGATPVNWDLRLECCGQPLRAMDPVISEALMRKKLEDARNAGADVAATACTYCQMQFDAERELLPQGDPLHTAPPAVLVTRLLAKALGIEESGKAF